MAFPPRISGRALHAVARLSRTAPGARLLYQVFRSDLRIGQLEQLPDPLLGDTPVDNRPLAGRPPRAGGAGDGAGLPLPSAPWSFTSATLAEAYRAKKTTPREVVDRALEAARALASRRPSVGPLMEYTDEAARRDAAASTERWKAGKTLGPLDGVPIAVKEELAVRGLPTRGGTDLSDATPAVEDATMVARLRAAGAIVLGHTPMTEYGMTPLGFNPKRTMPRNPHATDRVAGGSSTGSAVAVATGLVPFALGGDGGGSIRIPSSLCGVFGIKATWGRVSRHGDVFGGTVAHVGPLASSTLDLARCLEVTSGHDPHDAQSWLAPHREPGSFERALGRGVRRMKIGVVESEWADASPAVARAGREAMRALEKEGATLVDLRMELARWAAPAGYLAIGMESRAAHRALLAEEAPFTPDLRISYAVLGAMSAEEYLLAQRLRDGLRRECAQAFQEVDLLALPSTATPATRVTDAEFEGGFLDARALDAMCRFMFLGNLTGLPALSAPVGLDEGRAPLGFQLVGDAWDEATVLAAAAHLERIGAARVEKPAVTAPGS
ncbi:MAG TPA: amidase [Polyangiaceae bacterium]|jgi:aspartyl-tRNA(Asn)/glutamyl-tRNA(Gln) amidotransferase subunit A